MTKLKLSQLKQIVEAAIFVAEQPVTVRHLQRTVLEGESVSKDSIQQVLSELTEDYQGRGVRLIEVASGYRFQSAQSLSPWLGKLCQESAPKYSRAMLETLALVAYRQPITRGEIEDVRGVAVSSHIMKTLVERNWVKAVGHKDVAGKPALYATTEQFLDYFNLTSLADLPSQHSFVESAVLTPGELLTDSPSSAEQTPENKQLNSSESPDSVDEPEQLH